MTVQRMAVTESDRKMLAACGDARVYQARFSGRHRQQMPACSQKQARLWWQQVRRAKKGCQVE